MSSHQHEHAAHNGAAHGTLKDYVIGFVLASILTIIPFWLVMGKVIDDKNTLIAIIFLLGLAQMIVHIIFFLHIKPTTESGWTLVSLVFTVITIIICLVGSIAIMSKIHDNMMPHHRNYDYVPESTKDLLYTNPE